MLLAKKIRLEINEQDAVALEFMQSKCRGLYNWLVMRLRAGEHWHFAEEKATLKACRTYDPELNDVYGKLLGVSEQKRNKRRDCLHKASHLIAHRLAERAVVIGDLSQRQMVTKAHAEHLKTLHRSVYNDWGLYGFVQMLQYKCQLAGKDLIQVNERDTSKMCSGCGEKQPMPLYKRIYRCGNCRLEMDRDENSAVNIRERFLARLGPHAQAS